MTVFVVVQDTGGAHEPAASWSIWTTAEAALAEATRLNSVHQVVPWGYLATQYKGDYVAGAMNKPKGSSGFYVVAVNVDVARDENIE